MPVATDESIASESGPRKRHFQRWSIMEARGWLAGQRCAAIAGHRPKAIRIPEGMECEFPRLLI